MEKKIIIAGGSGFVGKALTAFLLKKNYSVIVLTTNKKLVSKTDHVEFVYWNPEENEIATTLKFENYIVINLAGANVAKGRWTENRKKEILESRVKPILFLKKLHQEKRINITYFISASAIGFYGLTENFCDENTFGDNSFLSETCQKWEHAADEIKNLGVPTSILRLGIVLGKNEGALPSLIQSLNFKVAAIPSNGNQIMSWIHINDVVKMFFHLIEKKQVGIFNAVAPNPISYNVLFKEIKKLKSFWMLFHIPVWFLKIVLGEFATELTKSTKVSSKKIEDLGFQFEFPIIEDAFEELNK
ncbi:MAG: TIGR01777 family oxidoreductase [Chitinophagaceae bacterium]|nr:TIGR01777 family oxidoreductase [Chitinophagaceae bacterium]